MLLFLAATALSPAADDPPLQAQLAAAQDAENRPAVVDICQRLIAESPQDDAIWTTLIDALLEKEEVDRAAAAVDAFAQARTGKRAPLISDFRGDISFAHDDFAAAEKSWRDYLATKPNRADTARVWEKLGDLFVDQKRWRDLLEARTHQFEAGKTAANRVARAIALLRLEQWDAAFAEMRKANAQDPSDDQVEEWLPQFERFEKLLPQIKVLSAGLAKNPQNYDLRLDRARLFILTGRPLLAADDAQTALQAEPTSMRARVQLAEALYDAKDKEAAQKLEVSAQLARDGGHVEEGKLRELRTLDTSLRAKPSATEALVGRAKILRELNQFVLAQRDAESALKIDANSAAAHFELAQDLDGLGQTKEALEHATKATDLDASDSAKWYFRGLTEGKRADFAAAIQSLSHSLALRESAVALRTRAEYLRRIDDNARAEADETRLRDISPK